MNAEVLVRAKRAANLRKWGEQNCPDGTGPTVRRLRRRDAQQKETTAAQRAGKVTYFQILKEEVLEVSCEADEEKLLAELVDVAAVAQDWIDSILRRHATALATPEDFIGEIGQKTVKSPESGRVGGSACILPTGANTNRVCGIGGKSP